MSSGQRRVSAASEDPWRVRRHFHFSSWSEVWNQSPSLQTRSYPTQVQLQPPDNLLAEQHGKEETSRQDMSEYVWIMLLLVAGWVAWSKSTTWPRDGHWSGAFQQWSCQRGRQLWHSQWSWPRSQDQDSVRSWVGAWASRQTVASSQSFFCDKCLIMSSISLSDILIQNLPNLLIFKQLNQRLFS